MSSTLCSYPFSHQHIDPNGNIKYCCNSTPNSNIDEQGRHYNVQTHSMQEAWNGPSIRQLRKDLISGLEPEACQGCWIRENPDHTVGSSMRLQAALTQMPLKTIQSQIEYATHHDGFVDSDPQDFQIMSGNLCNLACKMCGPRYSSNYIKFFKSRGYEDLSQVVFRPNINSIDNPEDQQIYQGEDLDWPVTKPLKGIFQDYNKSIQHIFLTGGEPTLIAENIEFLEGLVETGDSQHIRLRFSTNCTNINQRMLNVLSQFKSIGINISLDGMDNIAYIQRTPSNWDTILKNVDYLIEWLREYQRTTKRNALISTNTVVSALNIHHVLDLWLFLSERYSTEFHLGFTPLMDPQDNYYIGVIPNAVRDKILEHYNSIKNRFPAEIQNKLKSFEYCLQQNVYQDNYNEIQYLLNNIQGLHPELNIGEIYSIYYPDAI